VKKIAYHGDELGLHFQEAGEVERTQGVLEHVRGISLPGHVLHILPGIINEAEEPPVMPVRIPGFERPEER
jgi:hypothetical protein